MAALLFAKAVVAEEDQKTREMNVSTQNCSADPPWQLFPLIYSAEFCVALLGNTFALWQLVTRERKNWHTGVVFSCNLAISDLLYILTLPLIIISYAHQKVWTFGATACKVERFLFTCNLYASISFIMCISVNRYVAIAYPLLTRSYLRPKHAKVASLLVWFSAIVLSSPVFAYANTSPRNNDLRCLSYSSTDVNQHFHYRVCLLVLGFLMPLVVTMASYCGVMWVVFKNANITHLEKKKVALMVGSVCVLYAVSFVPYHVLQTYKFYLWKSTKVCWVKKAYQVTTVLAPLNMCIHPILYMAVSDSIRTACCRRGSDE